MPNIDLAFKSVSDQAGRMVESSWKRILAIAQNHVQEFEEHEDNMDGFQRNSNDTRRSRSTANSSEVNHQIHSSDQSQTDFYDRERHMVHALDTLFTLAYEGMKKQPHFIDAIIDLCEMCFRPRLPGIYRNNYLQS